MAVRTQSSFARATISSGRIKASEEKRLQSAIDRIEDSIEKYNESVKDSKDTKSKWGWMSEIGKAFTTLGAVTANPVIGGIGLALTSGGSAGEYYSVSGLEDEANAIETQAAAELSNLLFVGEEAKQAGKGAEKFKTVATDAAGKMREGALWEGVLDIGKSAVGAGQSGLFGEGTANFLNKPLFDVGSAPEGAGTIEKLGYQYMKSESPSVGSLLGGVTPHEQEVYGKIFSSPNSITDGNTIEALNDPTTTTTETIGDFSNIPVNTDATATSVPTPDATVTNVPISDAPIADVPDTEGINGTLGEISGIPNENITSKDAYDNFSLRQGKGLDGVNPLSSLSYDPQFIKEFESEYSKYGSNWDEIVKEFSRASKGAFSDWSKYSKAGVQGETILDMTKPNNNPMMVDPEELARIRAMITGTE